MQEGLQLGPEEAASLRAALAAAELRAEAAEVRIPMMSAACSGLMPAGYSDRCRPPVPIDVGRVRLGR